MSSTTTAKSPTRHAHFSVNAAPEPKKHERILTIRYGKNQMALIRKRLRVEGWLYDSLESLLQEAQQQHQVRRVEEGALANNNSSGADIDIDIDQILDVEGDLERRLWLQEKLKDCKANSESIQKFITEFLDRLKTL